MENHVFAACQVPGLETLLPEKEKEIGGITGDGESAASKSFASDGLEILDC